MVGGRTQGTLSDSMATANMLKGLIGLGILALPFATMQIGWLPSIVGFAVIAFMTAWGIVIGVRSLEALEPMKNEETALVRRVTDCENLSTSYSEAKSESGAFGLGPYDDVVARAYGLSGQILCAVCIAMVQFATGVAYVDTLGENVESFFLGHDFRLKILMILGFVLWILSTVETLSGVATLSIIALLTYFFIFAGLIDQYIHDFTEKAFDQSALVIKRHGFSIGTWFGVSQFAFGGFPIAMIIYEDMAEPRNIFKVTSWTFTLCWVLYSIFAILGYTCFGEHTTGIIYMSFEKDLFRTGSIISICAILCLSYVLNMWPIFKCVQQFCSGHPPLDRLHYTAVRGVVVASTIIVAYMMPSLIVVIDVLGSLAGALTSFVLPALVYLKLKKHLEIWEVALCWLMVLLGFVGGLKASCMT